MGSRRSSRERNPEQSSALLLLLLSLSLVALLFGTVMTVDQSPNYPTIGPSGGPTPTAGVVGDSDFDGIPDREDECRYEQGLVSNNGCPPPQSLIAQCRSESEDLAESVLIYEPNEEMILGEGHRVQAVVSRDLDISPQEALPEASAPESRAIETTCQVTATLAYEAQDFDVGSIHQSQTTVMVDGQDALWEWVVTPWRVGQAQSLTLVVESTLSDGLGELSVGSSRVTADINVVVADEIVALQEWLNALAGGLSVVPSDTGLTAGTSAPFEPALDITWGRAIPIERQPLDQLRIQALASSGPEILSFEPNRAEASLEFDATASKVESLLLPGIVASPKQARSDQPVAISVDIGYQRYNGESYETVHGLTARSDLTTTVEILPRPKSRWDQVEDVTGSSTVRLLFGGGVLVLLMRKLPGVSSRIRARFKGDNADGDMGGPYL